MSAQPLPKQQAKKGPQNAKEAFAIAEYEQAEQFYTQDLGDENITSAQRRVLLSNRCLVRLKLYKTEAAYDDILKVVRSEIPDEAKKIGMAENMLQWCENPQGASISESIARFAAALSTTEDDAVFFQKAFYRRGLCELRLGMAKKADVSFQIAHTLDSSLQLTIDCIAEARYVQEQERTGLGTGTGYSGVYNWKKFMDYYLEPWDWSTTCITRTDEEKKKNKEQDLIAQQEARMKGEKIPFRKVKDPLIMGNYIHEAVEKRAILGKGRGLVVTKPVLAGTLLVVEKAFVTGRNQFIIKQTEEKLERLKKLGEEGSEDAKQEYEKFFALSDGSKESERSFDCDNKRTVEDILNFNTHSCQLVDTYNAPVKVSTDLERSGLWLTCAYINHSCLPTVHRNICDKYIMIRAARDLSPGDELLDSYCEILYPLAARNDVLKGYGFSSTGFRASLEAAVLDEKKTKELIWNYKCVDEDMCNNAEAYVVRSLDTWLKGEKDGAGSDSAKQLWKELPSDWVSKFCKLPGFDYDADKNELVPNATFKLHLIPADRFQEFRYGFSKPSTPDEEKQFAFQQDLCSLLLASFAKLFKQHAYTLKETGNNNYTEVASAMDRFEKILSAVLPYSELHVEIVSDRLNQRALAQNLTLSPLKKEVMETVSVMEKCYCFGESYSGVGAVWDRLAKQLFSAEMRAEITAMYVGEKKRLEKMGGGGNKKGGNGASMENKVFAELKAAVAATLPAKIIPEKKPATRSAFSFDRPAGSEKKESKPKAPVVEKVEKVVEKAPVKESVKEPEEVEELVAEAEEPKKPSPKKEKPTPKPKASPLNESVEETDKGTTIKIPNLDSCPDVLQDGRVIKVGEHDLEIPKALVGVEFGVKYSKKRKELSLMWALN